MLVIRKKICAECKKEFIAVSPKHKHCTRKCFMIAYRKKQREVTFPKWRCPNCNQETQLDFNPVKKKLKWITYKCPKCKYSRLDESMEIN